MGDVADDPGSVQRSFRLSARTVELLDSAAEVAGESRNALADRLLGEALRVERHPLIRFHHGAAGRRQPIVTGTRLYVHQIIATLRASDGDVDEAATYLGLSAKSEPPSTITLTSATRSTRTPPSPSGSRTANENDGSASNGH
jgi:uncharacterized protein (DUF433 family)